LIPQCITGQGIKMDGSCREIPVKKGWF